MKIDKHLRDLSDRLNAVSGSSNDNNEITRDDDYYLAIGSEPPRFAYYRQVRIDNPMTNGRRKHYEAVYESITQDELDYSLKGKLRVKSPEERYQYGKSQLVFP